MNYPYAKQTNQIRQVTTRFLGLTRQAVGPEGAFSECVNLSSDEYPALCVRNGWDVHLQRGEYENIQAIISGMCSGFCGVANGVFYYDGNIIPYDSVSYSRISANSYIKLFQQSKVIYIYEKRTDGTSELYYVDTLETKTENNVVTPNIVIHEAGDIAEKDAKLINAYRGSGDNGGYFVGKKLSYAAGEAWYNRNFKANDSVIIYAPSDKEYYMSYPETRYMKPAGAAYCKVMGFGSGIINDAGSDSERTKIYGAKIQFYKSDGEQVTNPNNNLSNTQLYDAIIYKRIVPQICVPEIYKGRLWSGTSDGSTIIASAFDDFRNFYDFSGLSSDSVEIEVSTPGEFVGMYRYGESVIAFKKDCMTVIYGDTANNFSIGKEIANVGTIDIRSCKIIDGVLYFAGRDGIWAYSGGQPQFISKGMDACYEEAIAFCHLGKYYIEGKRKNGEKEILVYDTRSRIWMCEESIDAVYAEESEGTVYIARAEEIYKLKDTGGSDDNWRFTTCRLWMDFTKSAITEISVRCTLSSGASLQIKTVDEDGEEKTHGEFTGDGRMHTFRVGVRILEQEAYQIKICGTGDCIIYAIERIVSPGGRNIKE